eukprot:7186497-Pyramimonas_sp.AAC.1
MPFFGPTTATLPSGTLPPPSPRPQKSLMNFASYLNAQLGDINKALETVSAVLLPIQRMHASKYAPIDKEPKAAKGKARAKPAARPAAASN